MTTLTSPFGTLDQDLEYLWKKFKSPTFDASTGLSYEELKRGATEFAESMRGAPHPLIKARAFEFIARNVQIDTDPHDWFPAFGCWNRNDRPLTQLLGGFRNEVCSTKCSHGELWDRLNRSGANSIGIDFDHSVPDWDAMLPLGFPGLLKRVQTYRKRRLVSGESTPATDAYFDGIEITYTAILELVGRLQNMATSRASESPRLAMEATCLDQLRIGAPRNTYEVLQFIYLYFIFSEHIDRLQVRSLGNLDNLLLPFFERDLKLGTFTESQIRELVDYFLMQYASIDNYWGHPFYLGGTDASGKSRINKLSYLILEEFDKLSIPTPKIQLKIASNTPDAFLDAALKMIRHGNSSLVFVGETGIHRVLDSLGMPEEAARTCAISGCYELNPIGKYHFVHTGVGHVNLLKLIELIFHNGTDPGTGLEVGEKTGSLEKLKTFEDFCNAYLVQLERNIEDNMTVVNDFERFLNEINPSNVYSATVEHSLETARDAFHNGSWHNNTSMLFVGFASAVDALEVIRELVYEKKELTLQEFKQVLDRNWQGHEKLRNRVWRCDHYGNGIESVDQLAIWLSQFIAKKVNRRPNARGGVWMASGHTARHFIVLGDKTGATPDGRYAGEEMSKNLSPIQGADVEGITALIRSITAMDVTSFPGDFPLDAMLHPSAVAGEDGLAAWRKLIRIYFERGGLDIHFNVFDAETLREAQRHPEKYAGLQIRVCGWNVHFVELAKKEQDMYIRRADTRI